MTTIAVTPDAIAELTRAKARAENELYTMRRINHAFGGGRREFLRRGFADADNAAALAAMFEIPLDVIATRATEELHRATREGKDADSRDDAENAEDAGGVAVEDTPEPAAPVADAGAEEFTDPNDYIRIENIPYLHALADAQ